MHTVCTIKFMCLMLGHYSNMKVYVLTQHYAFNKLPWSSLSIYACTYMLSFVYRQGTKDQHFMMSTSMWYQNVHTNGDSLEHCCTLVKKNQILSSVTFTMIQKNAVGAYCLDGQKKILLLHGMSCFQLLIIFLSTLFLKLRPMV